MFNNHILNRTVFQLTHLLAVVGTLGALFTGLRFAASHRTFPFWLTSLLPQGSLHTWHVLFAALLLIGAFCYTLIRITKKQKLRAASRYHVWVNRYGYLVVCIVFISGILHWAGFQGDTAHWHFYTTICLIIYLLLHSYVYIVQLGKQAIKRTLRLPRGTKPVALISLLIAGLCGLVIQQQVIHLPSKPLYITQMNIDTYIHIDGKPLEAAWQQTPSRFVHTTSGANFNSGNTTVEVKALANAYESYFLFRWQDSTHSISHLPLKKQGNKWQIKQQGFQRFDERKHYEDKFAVMLSSTCGIGADGTAHLGRQPLVNRPANFHGRGYHAALDGKVRDLWHWKAVRTNDMYLADDNYFGAPIAATSGKRRYTAGYHPDGKESGAYVMNWAWYNQQQVTPKRLPLSSYLGSAKQVLPWFESTPYRIELDRYPEGHELPSVLYRSNRFEGDRANVRARGHWQDGFWTLEVVRQHHTGSDYDIPLATGTCMWVAAFDAAQIAHTRHHIPLELKYL
ncbi:ethylbenzene dehydrogenase-related protein [Pseudoalteromonas sp. T1lg65]|uniref:ethylbenzene dehydrogenase-related protein n=1 Tax=Pseudoalteromonas sp. T1lg65 TaxID=2077101 RepID=UPI003F79ADE1